MDATRADYEKKMEKQLDSWSTKLAALQVKAESAGAEQKKALLADLAELTRLQASGMEHVAAVKAAAASGWDAAKAGLTDKWNHVSGAADAILARIQ